MPKEIFNQSPFVISLYYFPLSLAVSPSLSLPYNSPGFASINMVREDV